jgi:hypothetical protein
VGDFEEGEGALGKAERVLGHAWVDGGGQGGVAGWKG